MGPEPLFLVRPEKAMAADGPGAAVEDLFTKYAAAVADIHRIASYMGDREWATMRYFFDGNLHDRDRSYPYMVAEKLFAPEGALKALDADYWQRALDLTDVLQSMNAKRRIEWHEQIQKRATPPFTADNVAATLDELLRMRPQFFGERVAGVFDRLSSHHVTNRPQGFSARMIVEYVHSGGKDYQYANHQTVEYFSDIRAVVAKFMGSDEPRYQTTSAIIETCMKAWGQWVDVDGGSMRWRVFKKGTGHIEVHPDMAWRLNAMLAHVRPNAIAAEHVRRPATKARTWPRPIRRPLPMRALEILADVLRNGRNGDFGLPYEWDKEQAAREGVEWALAAIGAVRRGNELQFPYPDAAGVLRELVANGCVPDAKSHQFFPTPPTLCRIMALQVAGVVPDGESAVVLEPSAGQGGLAECLREHGYSVGCVEIDPLHCAVLRAKGFNAECADFLEWVQRGVTVDAVVMNPPFGDGQWKAHLVAAAGRVRIGGRLIACLPSSARFAKIPWPREPESIRWGAPIADEFDGTGVSVVLVEVRL